MSRRAEAAPIYHVDADTGERKRKRLHDVCGTFATRLMLKTDLTDSEIAGLMGWSEADVARIRRIYVDDTARTVALGERIARGL